MKKIITIITAFALCLTAFAKDINTLTSEYTAIVDGKAFSETKDATKAYVDENSNELLKAFDTWKTSDYANKMFASDAYKKASADARKTMRIQTAMFARLYDYYHSIRCVCYLFVFQLDSLLSRALSTCEGLQLDIQRTSNS